MNADYANPFIDSAVEVLQHELGIELKNRQLNLKQSPTPGYPIAIIIGLTGFLTGQIVYSLDQNFALEATKKMLPNKLPAEIKKLTNSAVSEIANMITGKASIVLAGKNELIHLTPPSVVTGSDINVDFLNLPTLVLQFDSLIGVLEINIAFRENKS